MFKTDSDSRPSNRSFSFVPTRFIPAGAFSLPSTRCTSRRASESPASSGATFRPARADSRTRPRVARHRSDRFPVSRKTPGIISQTFHQGAFAPRSQFLIDAELMKKRQACREPVFLPIRERLLKNSHFAATLQALDQIILGEGCSEREMKREQPGQDVARLFHIVDSTVPASYLDPRGDNPDVPQIRNRESRPV
jgi:hypothetical protein